MEKDLPTPSIQAKQLFDSFILLFRRGLIYLYTYSLEFYVQEKIFTISKLVVI